MKQLQQYQLTYSTPQNELKVKNSYMSVNSNSTASQQNLKNILAQNFSHLSPMSLINLTDEYLREFSEKFESVLMVYYGAMRKLIVKKPEAENLVSDSL